jgi:hypothetical protein
MKAPTHLAAEQVNDLLLPRLVALNADFVARLRAHLVTSSATEQRVAGLARSAASASTWRLRQWEDTAPQDDADPAVQMLLRHLLLCLTDLHPQILNVLQDELRRSEEPTRRDAG